MNDPSPRDPERPSKCTCRYFRTDAQRDFTARHVETGHPLKQPNPDCPVCPYWWEAGPVATKRGDKWDIDDPPWW